MKSEMLKEGEGLQANVGFRGQSESGNYSSRLLLRGFKGLKGFCRPKSRCHSAQIRCSAPQSGLGLPTP